MERMTENLLMFYRGKRNIWAEYFMSNIYINSQIMFMDNHKETHLICKMLMNNRADRIFKAGVEALGLN